MADARHPEDGPDAGGRAGPQALAPAPRARDVRRGHAGAGARCRRVPGELLRELASQTFFGTPDHDILYRSRDVRDAIFVAFPVNEDAESYFGWYRVGEASAPFSPHDRDVLAYALRALKWFHRRVMLHHG